jgi:transposase-like protein
MVQLILEPGASVAEVPRAHGVNASQMFAWRRAFERGELTQPCSALLLASASFVRDAVFTARWTGFVNSGRHPGTSLGH